MPQWLAGTLSALMTTWVTFLPCFLWIFLGAPHIERLRGVRWLSAVLSTITAAVVGVVLNLAVWFAQHTIVPDSGRTSVFAIVVGALAFVVLQKYASGAIPVILGCGVLGVAYRALAG